MGCEMIAVLRLSALAMVFMMPLHHAGRWFDFGHRMVARIAEQRLRAHTLAAVRDILEGQSLADASVWADNIKQYRHDADALHYVDWAMEGHRIAAEHAYRLPRGGRVDERYLEANRPIIDHAIIAAVVLVEEVGPVRGRCGGDAGVAGRIHRRSSLTMRCRSPNSCHRYPPSTAAS